MYNVILCPRPPLWNPATVAQLVLDADTIAQADGTVVASWNSIGSVTSYIAGSTADSPPILVKNVLGGRATVRFNGSNSLKIPAFDSGTVSLTMVMLIKLSALGNYPMVIVYGSSAVNDWEMRGSGGTGTLQFIASGGANSFGSNVDMMAWHILEGVYLAANNSCGVYADGTSLGANTGAVTLTSGDVVWVGRRTDNYLFTGDIACLMIVKGDLANADRQRIEGWIAWRWGLTASLPANHPYKSIPPLAS